MWLAGCGHTGDFAPDAAQGDGNYPPPRDNLVPAVGTDDTLDIATWNIENFPMKSSTPAVLADLITSLRLDIVAVQEIEDTAAFDEVIARLPNHEGVLSTHTYGNGSYQKIGFIYRSDLVQVETPTRLFNNEGYYFPRPPLQATITVDDGIHASFDFIAITVHLKAGFDSEDRSRRAQATVLLEAHVRDLVNGSGDDEVIVLGDFNEVVTSVGGAATLSPWLDDDDAYRVHTEALAQLGEASFLPSDVILDHVVTTAALDDEIGNGATVIPLVDQQYPSYRSGVSDHVPVVLQLPVFQ